MSVLVLGAFVTILNQTLLNVAIPHLMNEFNVSANTVQWLSTGYMLTNGVLIPITPFLIGRLSTRKLFISAMVAFLIGSIICAVAPGFTVMMIGRIVQAIGAGVMMPLMMTVILFIYPPEVRGRAMGTMAIAMFFAPALGPTLSGWIIEHWTWRILFYVGMPIAIFDIIFALIMLPNVSKLTNPKFDFAGFITSTMGFGLILYAFSEAGNNGWGDPRVVMSLIGGVIFVVLFIIRELTTEEPMLDLRVFKYNVFTISTLVSCVVNMAMFGAMILVPIYIQNIRGFSPLQAGLLLLPGAIVMAIMSPIAGALFDKIGARPLAIVGLTITTITTWYFSQLTMATPYSHVMLLYTLRMFGMSFIAMTIMTAGLNQLPRQFASHGTAASNTARQIAASIGTAILVTVMTTRTTFHVGTYRDTLTTTNPMLNSMLADLGQKLAMQLGLPVQAGTALVGQYLYKMVMQQSTVDGINDAFIVATILTFIALVLSFFLKRVKPVAIVKAEVEKNAE
ncbi:MAG: transporter [Bacilli bacterium]|nr:transporter [Bacilli bacterium]